MTNFCWWNTFNRDTLNDCFSIPIFQDFPSFDDSNFNRTEHKENDLHENREQTEIKQSEQSYAPKTAQEEVARDEEKDVACEQKEDGCAIIDPNDLDIPTFMREQSKEK